jgi:glycolate oxidase FAD binding subunit
MVLGCVLMIFFTGRLITFMKSFSTENYVSTQELESIVGTAGVCLRQYTEVFWQERVEKAVAPGTKIDCTVYPNTQEELAAVIEAARNNRWGVLPDGKRQQTRLGGFS